MRHRVLLFAGCVAVLSATGAVHAQKPAEPVKRVRAEPQPRSTSVYRLVEGKRATFDVMGVGAVNMSHGSLEIEYKRGHAAMRLRLNRLTHPQRVGAAYTAYVFWGVTGDGKVIRLGELPVDEGVDLKADLTSQTVGILATAEPYAEVARPSPQFVLEFTLRDKFDKNAPVVSSTRYVGDDGHLYSDAGTTAQPDFSTPLLVLSARHAVAVARRAGAAEFAPAEWRAVDIKLGVLEQLWPDQRNNESKFSGLAREVVRLADAARRIGGERADSAAAEAERQATAARLARAASEVETAQKLKAEAERDAERARAFADSVNEVAARTLRYADSVRAAADAAQQEAIAARQERDAARARLASSIGAILDTKREARGLVVNLSDVLFTTGQAVLQPGARENLSKLSGILLAYPGPYTLAIAGHTDSVGSDALNDRLSLARAASVRDYLLEAGIDAARVTSVTGYGKRQPVADNATAEGRAKNRRVEIVIDDADPADE